MTGKRPVLTLLHSWLLLGATFSLLATASRAGAAGKHDDLTVEASAWVFPSRPLTITIEQSGVLAGRHLAVYLFVDQNQFERVTTAADRTMTAIELPELSPGRHVLVARVGTEVAQTEFRLVPWSWLTGALLAAAGGVGLGLVGRHRRRRQRERSQR